MDRKHLGGYELIVALVFLVAIFLVAGVYTLGTWGSVEVGHASLIKNTWDGTIKAGPIGPLDKPGVKSFMFEDLITIKISVDNVYMWSKFDENFKEVEHGDWEAPVGITSDGIKMPIDINVFWTIDPQSEKLINLYRQYPTLDYKERVIVQAAREVVRDVMKDKTFDQIIEQREQLPTLISDGVIRKITENPTLQGIIKIDRTSIQILEIHMPPTVQQKLQERKNSEIAIITAENNRRVAIINADAERQQNILRSQGLAQAKIIEANATRDAILNVVTSLGVEKGEAQAQASQLYLTLQMYKEIAATGQNVTFIVGLDKDGNSFILPLDRGAKP